MRSLIKEVESVGENKMQERSTTETVVMSGSDVEFSRLAARTDRAVASRLSCITE